MARTVVPWGTRLSASLTDAAGSRCGDSRRRRSTKLEFVESLKTRRQRSSFIWLLCRAPASHAVAGPGNVAEEVAGRRRFRQQLPDVRLGPAQGLEHEDLLQR